MGKLAKAASDVFSDEVAGGYDFIGKVISGNAIIIAPEVKNAEQAEAYASDKFERLAALEKEIDASLNELKKFSGMEKYSTEFLRNSLGEGIGLGTVTAGTVAAAIALPVVGLPFLIGGGLIKGLFGGKDFSKPIQQLAEGQKDIYERLVKVSRIQVLLFEFQRVMAEILNELFEMCSSNIEVVQATINTLRMKLDKNATSMTESTKQNVRDLIKKLASRKASLLAQEEMKTQIRQLKDEVAELRSMIQK